MVFYEFVTPRLVFEPFRAFIAIVAVFLSGKYSEVFLNIKGHSKRIYILFNIAYTTVFVISKCSFFPSLLLLCYLLVNILTLVFLLLIVYSIIYLYYKRKPVDTFSLLVFCFDCGFAVFILQFWFTNFF
jgi:hypothetical protein